MEPLSLAAAAVGLLVSFFQQTASKIAERASESIAEAALPKVRALYERVRAELAPGSYQGALLDGVQAKPENGGRQQILRAELAELLAQDQQFAAELERLVGEAEQERMRIAVTDAGVVAGRDANLRGQYVAGRDQSIGGTPDDKR